ncbi:hypothetical protein SEA_FRANKENWEENIE_348 [Streptomyces phage Frankenweenie]|jgi:hypothetical protein|nr:hypothetical protein SEA_FRANKENWEENIE_348 [Streptomyces phage Frankenweenie]
MIFGLVFVLYFGCGLACMGLRYLWAGLRKIRDGKAG